METKKNKALYIIIAILALVLIIMLLIWFLNSKADKNKNNESDKTTLVCETISNDLDYETATVTYVYYFRFEDEKLKEVEYKYVYELDNVEEYNKIYNQYREDDEKKYFTKEEFDALEDKTFTFNFEPKKAEEADDVTLEATKLTHEEDGFNCTIE